MVEKKDEAPVALITGAARRIGRHLAEALAMEGWNIVVHHRSSPEDAAETLRRLEGIGGHHCVLQADLSNEAQTRRLFEEAVQQWGRVDAVINNASLFEYDDAGTFSCESLLEHMLPNLGAPLILAQALHQHITQTRPGSTGVVVNLLDQKLGNPNPDFLSYTLSKSALKTATTLLAKALAPHVRVVGLSPGLTLPSHLQTEQAFEEAHRLAPLGQASTPSDITRAAVFLLQSPAITGVDLVVDGGQHLLGMERDFSMMELEPARNPG